MAVLQGKCGSKVTNHTKNLAPCHLPNIDPTIDPTLARPPLTLPCIVCNDVNNAGKMLLCDGCGTGWHTYCLDQPLGAVPEDDWICPTCVTAGVTPAVVQARTEAAAAAPTPPVPAGKLFPRAATKAIGAEAQSYDKRLVLKQFNNPITGRTKNFWGLATFRGAFHRPDYFLVRYTYNDDEHMTLDQLKEVVQPVNAKVPAAAKAALRRLPALMAFVPTPLPDAWDLTARNLSAR